MRTTVEIDDEVLEAARAIARLQGKSLGRVISELLHQGLASPVPPIEEERGFPVFKVAADAPPLTPEMVRRALEDDA